MSNSDSITKTSTNQAVFQPGRAALRYADQFGWYVFPCDENDKRPHVTGGINPKTGEPYRFQWGKYATNNSREIKRLWGQWPRANIGLPAKPNGLIMIDADPEGLDAWINIYATYDLPDTLTANTPSGGAHLIFRKPENVVIGNHDLAPGINVRGVKGDGGYIVIAPSVHPNGLAYRWAWQQGPGEIEIVPLPQALIDLLTPAPAITTPPPHVNPIILESDEHRARYARAVFDHAVNRLRQAQVSNRNISLFKAAFQMGTLIGARFIAEADAEAALTAIALSIGLSESETAATIRSGIKGGVTVPLTIPTYHDRRMTRIRAALEAAHA